MIYYITQRGLKQWIFTKAYLESKSKWANGQEISYIQKNKALSRKWEIKIKPLNIFMIEKKKLFISVDIRKPPMLVSYSLQHPIDKTGSTTSFSSEESFPEVSC